MNRVPAIAFFNNKGGVGKTSLVYHLAWMQSEMNRKCLAVDLDPQSNLTAFMLDEDQVEELWQGGGDATGTIYSAIEPQIQGTGDIAEIEAIAITSDLSLLPGDLRLSAFEDKLSQEWPRAIDRKQDAFRILTAFSRSMQRLAQSCSAEYILVDVGPNLGALNRAALIACDFVVVPLAPDLFSMQGLRNLGPTLRTWRSDWNRRLESKPQDLDLILPPGQMLPIGYIVQQHPVRLDRPVKAYQKWVERIPAVYSESVLEEEASGLTIDEDPNCLGLLKHFASLVPLAQEARKPVFKLQSADGALGAHAESARLAGLAYRRLAEAILSRITQ